MHLTKLSDKKFTALSGVEYDVGVGQDELKEHSLYIGSRVETVRGIGVIVGLVGSDIYVYTNDNQSQSDINTAKLYQNEESSNNNDMTNNNVNDKIYIEAIPFSLTDLGTHVIRTTDTNFTLIDSNTECSAQDNSIKRNATESHKNTTASTPVSNNVTHRVKKIVLHGKCVTIVTQEKEGPCPVIALANALALQGEISLSSYTYRITATELRSVIASYLWSREHRPPRFVFKGANRCTENKRSCYDNNSSCDNNKNKEEKKFHEAQNNDEEENPLDVNPSQEQRAKEETMLREAVQDANSFITIRRKLIGEDVRTSIAESTLEKLYTGLDIDPIFSDVEAFALNDDEVALFALAGVRLVHGWVMSPSMECSFDPNKYYCYNKNSVNSNDANCFCINNSSTISKYNTELSNCTEYSSTNDISDTNTIESITNWLRHLSFNELATFLASTSSECTPSRTTPLTSSSIKSTFSSVSGKMTNTFDKYYTNTSICEDDTYTDEDSDNKKMNTKDDSSDSHCKVDHTMMLTRNKLANEFFQSTYATQMTHYGASMLSNAISENEVVVLYWRWHFFTLIKMHGRLLTLCSNENFVDKPSFVFSVLDTKLLEENGFADGDGNDVNSVLSYVQANVGNMFTEEEIHAAHAELIKQHFQSTTCLPEKESDSGAAVNAEAELEVDPAKVLEYLQAKRKIGSDNKSNMVLMQTNKYPLHDVSHNIASTAESSSSLAITSSQTTNTSDSTIHDSSICNTRESDDKSNITNAESKPVSLIAPSETWFNVDRPRSRTLTDNLEGINTNVLNTCHSTHTNEENVNDVVLEFMERFPDVSRAEALEFVQNNNNNLGAAADAYCRRYF